MTSARHATQGLADRLAAGRIALRPLRRSDAGLLELYASDARLARMTANIPHPYPPGAPEAFIERSLDGRRGEHVWVMDGWPSDGPELIGVIGARAKPGGVYEIGYWVAYPFWNTGYASEAVECVAQHLLAHGARRLEARVFHDNPGSARVLEKAGFVEDGDTEVYSVARGAAVPARRFALERPE